MYKMIKRIIIVIFLLCIIQTGILSQTIEGEWYFFNNVHTYGEVVQMKVNKKGIEFATLDSALNVTRKLEVGGYNAKDKLEIEKNGFIYFVVRNYKEDYVAFKLKKNKQDLDAYMFYGNGYEKFHLSELDSLIEGDTVYTIRTGKLYSKSSLNKIMKLKSVYEMTDKDEREYLYQLNINVLSFYKTLIDNSAKNQNYDYSDIREWCGDDVFFETKFSSETLIQMGYKPLISGYQYYYFYNVLLDKYPNICSFKEIINSL